MTKTGEDGDWIKIEFEGQTGYVRGRYVPVDRRKRTVALIDFRRYSEKVKVTAFCFTGKKNPNTGGVKEWKVFG